MAGIYFEVRPTYTGEIMITNYLYLNRELLDDVYGKLGRILVVTKDRASAVNFYNELLGKYNNYTGALRDDGKLTIASKASKITVRAVRNKSDLAGLQDDTFTRIYTVGYYDQEEHDFLLQCIRAF